MAIYLRLKTKIHSRSVIVRHTFNDRFGMSDANDTIIFFINSLDTLAGFKKMIDSFDIA